MLIEAETDQEGEVSSLAVTRAGLKKKGPIQWQDQEAIRQKVTKKLEALSEPLQEQSQVETQKQPECSPIPGKFGSNSGASGSKYDSDSIFDALVHANV